MYEFFLALLETAMLEVGLLVREGQFFLFIYVAVDVIIVSVIILLQIETIRKSHSLHGESSITAARRTNQTITKLSMRIMILLCIFATSCSIIMNLIGTNNLDWLISHDKFISEFVYPMYSSLVFTNSFTNVLLLLMMNVKAKRLFRDLVKW